MSAIDPPTCRLCGRTHWQRAGCDFGKNIQRAPAKASANMTKADKVRPGKPKTARKAKKKGTKK